MASELLPHRAKAPAATQALLIWAGDLRDQRRRTQQSSQFDVRVAQNHIAGLPGMPYQRHLGRLLSGVGGRQTLLQAYGIDVARWHSSSDYRAAQVLRLAASADLRYRDQAVSLSRDYRAAPEADVARTLVSSLFAAPWTDDAPAAVAATARHADLLASQATAVADWLRAHLRTPRPWGEWEIAYRVLLLPDLAAADAAPQLRGRTDALAQLRTALPHARGTGGDDGPEWSRLLAATCGQGDVASPTDLLLGYATPDTAVALATIIDTYVTQVFGRIEHDADKKLLLL